jgi:hypothetical protein
MVEIERLSDPVRLSALRAALTDARIESFVFDSATGALFGGAAIRMRLMVDEQDERQARRVLRELGLDDPNHPPDLR